jgi:hypothetical protein
VHAEKFSTYLSVWSIRRSYVLDKLLTQSIITNTLCIRSVRYECAINELNIKQELLLKKAALDSMAFIRYCSNHQLFRKLVIIDLLFIRK